MKTIDADLSLRENVRLLGELLGKTIKAQHGQKLFELVENIRQLSKQVQNGEEDSRKELIKVLNDLNDEQMMGVVRAFSHFLNLANIAEDHHRIRRRRWHQKENIANPQKGSLEWVFNKFKKNNIPNDIILKAVDDLNIELVLTAHPTEVTRRTLMHKFEYIAKSLDKLDDCNITPYQKERNLAKLYEEITSIWQTEKTKKIPIILFNSKFWAGLLDWFKESLLKEKND